MLAYGTVRDADRVLAPSSESAENGNAVGNGGSGTPPYGGGGASTQTTLGGRKKRGIDGQSRFRAAFDSPAKRLVQALLYLDLIIICCCIEKI